MDTVWSWIKGILILVIVWLILCALIAGIRTLFNKLIKNDEDSFSDNFLEYFLKYSIQLIGFKTKKSPPSK
ncbi:hypothetical protein [Companilactobacillus zhongbaensis]|uniref:hypothetical protein n=1 Tax=Companilactobacillus zhongbaensis TaxID=2486009 RepID=UPI000F78B1CF|nr:hypothetical protein [Companilactobacillus zhongbaensis]